VGRKKQELVAIEAERVAAAIWPGAQLRPPLDRVPSWRFRPDGE
jgi:hypothetical protein